MSDVKLINEILSHDLETVIQIRNLLTKYIESKEPKFVKIPVINSNGNIAEQIQKETGYECYHKYPIQVMTSSRGTNYIKVPLEKYSSKLEKELIEKYDV